MKGNKKKNGSILSSGSNSGRLEESMGDFLEISVRGTQKEEILRKLRRGGHYYKVEVKDWKEEHVGEWLSEFGMQFKDILSRLDLGSAQELTGCVICCLKKNELKWKESIEKTAKFNIQLQYIQKCLNSDILVDRKFISFLSGVIEGHFMILGKESGLDRKGLLNEFIKVYRETRVIDYVDTI